MAPLVLKIKGNKSFSPFSNLDSEEDLSKTWRVCTKVKDSLENGSRLENLSWRLWFRQHALNEKSSGGPFQKLSKTTASQLDHHQANLTPSKGKNHQKLGTTPETGISLSTLGPQSLISNNYNNDSATLLDQQPISQPQQQPGVFPSIKSATNSPLIIDTSQTMNNFTLHQFTSDQARDQIVELKDIFDAFDKGFLQQGNTAHLMIEDSNWVSPAVTAATTTNKVASNYQNPSSTTMSSYANNTSNYGTPLSSPLETHSYNQPMESKTQQYHYHTYYQYHHQYDDQTNSRQQRPYLSSGNNNHGVFMSVPSSPSFVPQPMSSDFDPPSFLNRESDSMFVSHSSSLQHPPSTTGSSDLSHHGMTPQQSTQLTPYINNTSSTPPLSTSSSSATTVTAIPSKNDEISNEDDDYSRQPIKYTSSYDLACAQTATAMNDGQIYPQYQHQHVFPVSAPTTPPLHTQHQTNPFDSAPHKLNTATVSTSFTGKSDGAEAKPICTNCSATSTPLWRRSSEDELLCNACGLYQKLHNAPRPKTLKPHTSRKEAREEEAIQLICSNCSTTTTPLWRRDDDGSSLCNACGLYLKLHHEKRPLSMKTDVIKKRQRYDTNTQPNGRKMGKKTKGDSSSTTPSSSHSSPLQSTPSSPEVLAGSMVEKEYHMMHSSTAPSSPTSNQHLLPPYGYIHQHHLPY